ncbi:MAG: DUF3486 family protein [Defluviitaleaceae bacterium]|nr:DUF3486 family protein [Defluviitaleaceae bacterium]MCL2273407.1 DUF3486 family protein [Defluviitaleaceae bacterium]
MRDSNRSHSKISKLPTILRDAVEKQLLEGHTYEQIAEFLNSKGHEISHMSVQRYGKPYLKKFEQLREARAYAKQLAEDNADRPSTELNEVNNALAQQLLMEMYVSEGITPAEKEKTFRNLALLQQAQATTERLKIVSRKEAGVVKTAMNLLKKRVFDEIQTSHPDIAAVMLNIADEVANEIQKS